MPVPDFQTLMLPALKLAAKNEIRISDAVELLSEEFELTEAEREALLPSGKQARMANRVHWAFTYLAKGGLVERVARGTYAVSELGRTVLRSPPARIDIKFLSKFPKFEDFRNKSKEAEPESAEDNSSPTRGTPEERVDEAAAELELTLRSELLDRIRALTPTGFEKLIVGLMLSMGYGSGGAGAHIGKSGDGGIDGTITEDALGLDVIYLQAKRYADGNNVGVEKIREFAGTLDERGATKGVFVTTSKYANGARTYSSRSPKRLTLIDGEELTALMVRTIRKMEIRKIDTDYFDDLEQ
jgi:restriction system protein